MLPTLALPVVMLAAHQTQAEIAPIKSDDILNSEPTANPTSSPPNVLFILLDDWGIGDVNVYGNHRSTRVQTPNIDQLASESVVFTNGYSASPVCSPSRAAWMTGRFPAEVGIHSALPCTHCTEFLNSSSFPTITQVAHNAGYHVGHFGKVSDATVCVGILTTFFWVVKRVQCSHAHIMSS